MSDREQIARELAEELRLSVVNEHWYIINSSISADLSKQVLVLVPDLIRDALIDGRIARDRAIKVVAEMDEARKETVAKWSRRTYAAECARDTALAERDRLAEELAKLAKLKLEAETRELIAGRKRIIVQKSEE